MQSRWKSPLLWCVLLSFLFLSISGFALLFARAWLDGWPRISPTHFYAGLLTLVPYSIYQLSHYARIKQFHAQIHYKLGMLSFFSFLLSAISGSPLGTNPGTTFLSLLHIMSSFAFLIFLIAHLIVVARLATLRA